MQTVPTNQKPLQSKPAVQPREKRMLLSRVSTGRLDVPIKVLLYGVEGIGKSTFGASAPKPIFLSAEGGTAQLDVTRFPEPECWSDVLDAVQTLTLEEHDFKSLVVDTLDWVEPLVWAHVCQAAGQRNIEDLGFGKGYVKALDEWRLLVRSLEGLMARRAMNVVLLGHASVKTFKNPEGEDYDRYTLRMHDKAAGMWKEWANDVLFAQWETYSMPKKDGRETRKAVSDGNRVVRSVRAAAYDAKNRNALPETMPLSWDEYEAAVRAHTPKSVEELRAAVAVALESLPSHLREKASERAMALADDAVKLSVLLDWCRGKAEQPITGALPRRKRRHMNIIPQGRYIARAVGEVQFGISKDKGTDYIRANFEVQTDEGPRTLFKDFFFTEKTAERSIESLRHCGWTGNDLSQLNAAGNDGFGTCDVEVVVDHEQYDGKTYAKIEWVNRIGGGAVKVESAMSESAKKVFAARMKGLAMKIAPSASPTAKPAAVKPPKNAGEPRRNQPAPDDQPPFSDDTMP